jgi:ribonuclease HII
MLPDVDYPWVAEIRDSKKLSAKKREQLSALIRENCFWTLASADPYQIDEMNIFQATLMCMREAARRLCLEFMVDGQEILVLVDGNQTIPNLDLPGVKQQAVVGGDNIHKCIAAASIVAKVHRDQYMVSLDDILPMYGFARHKGYGTEEHREAIMVYGPSDIHRKTFRGVYEYVKSESLI